MAKVSIVLPIYNAAPFLAECMETVTRQTLRDIEIICVNDGSTDESPAMLEEYRQRDPRIVVISQPNGGYGKAMNTGLDAASGEYFGIVEPDDFVAEDMFGFLYDRAAKENLDFIKADFYKFRQNRETGDMTVTLQKLSKLPEQYHRVHQSSEDPQTLRFSMTIWNGIYRTAFLKENQIRFHETPGASYQDTGFFFLTFMLANRMMITDHPGYRYRMDNPNASQHNASKVFTVHEEFDYIRKQMEERGLWERFHYMYWWRHYIHDIDTLRRIGDEHKRAFVFRISELYRQAFASGEARLMEFSEAQQRTVRSIMDEPEQYYRKKLSRIG